MGIGRVEDGVEALKEGEAVDEVETFTRWRAEVVDDKQDVTWLTANGSVQGARPDLGVGGEAERGAPDVKVEVLERVVLRGGDAEQSGGAV